MSDSSQIHLLGISEHPARDDIGLVLRGADNKIRILSKWDMAASTIPSSTLVLTESAALKSNIGNFAFYAESLVYANLFQGEDLLLVTPTTAAIIHRSQPSELYSVATDSTGVEQTAWSTNSVSTAKNTVVPSMQLSTFSARK